MRIMFTLMMILSGFMAQAFNYGFGYSEMFIRIHEMNQPGRYTIRIDDQSITNSNGKFRFFDLAPGIKEVYVQRNGQNLYKGILTVYAGSRTVAEFRGVQGLQVIQQIQLQQNNQPQQDFWYGYWNYNSNGQWNNNNNGQWNNNNGNGQWNNNGQGNGNGNNNGQWNNNGNINNGPRGMDQNTFAQFKATVKDQSFDSNKVTVIKNAAKTANFNSTQVRELLQLMSFDSYKLETAKYCYDFVIDKASYFKTYDVFQFDSNVKELSNYTASRN